MINKEFEIAFDEAVKMLPDRDSIHTFRNPSGMLIGCDWDKPDLISAIKKFGVMKSGQTAEAMGHGLVLHDGKYLFIETKEPTPQGRGK